MPLQKAQHVCEAEQVLCLPRDQLYRTGENVQHDEHEGRAWRLSVGAGTALQGLPCMTLSRLGEAGVERD